MSRDCRSVRLSDMRDTYPARERLKALGARYRDGAWEVPADRYLEAVQAAPMRVPLHGDTYPHRDEIRAIGGYWSRVLRQWLVPETAESYALQARIAETVPATTATRRYLRAAVAAIDAACDGVNEEGWSRATYAAGRSLASCEEWTAGQWRRAALIVRAHRRQAERLIGEPMPADLAGV